MQKLLQDLRYGLRMLANAPGFTLVAILTLALGIGANTAIFGLIDSVMLRALPVSNPSELVLMQWSARNAPMIHGYMSAGDCPTNLRFGAANPSGCSFSEPMMREFASSDAFSGVAAFANTGRLDLTGNGPATVINGQEVSGDFFRTLGVKAAVGRVIETSDDLPQAAPVAVLNYGYWQSAFGGSRDVIGRTIQLNGVAVTIVGVAEPKFMGLTPGSDYDVWVPLADGGRLTSNQRMWANRQDNVTFWWLTVVGRLKPGHSVAQTQAQLAGIFSNEMLHGSVPIFAAGGGMPAPGGGSGQVRMQMTVGGGAGAPPPPSGLHGPVPTPAGGQQAPQGAVRMVGPGPGPGAAGKHLEPNAQPGAKGPTRQAPTPQGAQPAPPTGGPSDERRVVAGAPGNAAFGAPGGPDGQAEQTPATLSKPADNPTVTLVPAQSGLTGSRLQFANPLYVLMLAVGIILLIACANVAGLMLARSSARRREMAVRLALGAGRWRIIRQLVTESVLLSGLGGALGLPFAYWGANLIVRFVSTNQTRPLGYTTGVDLRVLAFTAAISILTGVFFGIAPALRGARVDLTPTLKEGYGVTGRGRARWLSTGNALVVAQVALAIVVLVGAGLLVRTLQNLRSVDMGFDSHNVVLFNVDPSLAGYKDTEIDSFYRDLQGRLSETPGVKSVSYSSMPLLSGGLMMTSFHWPGTPQDRESNANVLPVGRDFFATMQIRFLQGRDFNSSDYVLAAANDGPHPTAAPTPVIVNQAFVEKYVGKEPPLGKQFGGGPADEDGPANPGYEIVGVVGDAKYNSLRQTVDATMYQPQAGMGAAFEVRSAMDPQSLLPTVRRVVAELNPNLPLFQVTTESEQIDRLLFQERLIARVAGFFGLLALTLACIGLYGLLSYEVARRTREIGIRMALGAQGGDVLGLVVKQGLALAIIGSVVGVGVALGVTRYLASMLFDVKANDPLTIAIVALLLGLVAFAACYIPARRATRVDPLVALRYE
jgi:predicted permease